MDLNELLHAHQLEVMKASVSADENHLSLIAEYAERIRQLRTIVLTTPIPQDPAAPPMIIYGSYAGNTATQDDPAPFARACGSNREESENPDRGQADA